MQMLRMSRIAKKNELKGRVTAANAAGNAAAWSQAQAAHANIRRCNNGIR